MGAFVTGNAIDVQVPTSCVILLLHESCHVRLSYIAAFWMASRARINPKQGDAAKKQAPTGMLIREVILR